jgi:enediyne polyketide synthase
MSVMPETALKVLIEPLTVVNNHRTGTTDSLHRPDGKPDPFFESHFQSVAYSDNWKLFLDSALPVGCDLQNVSHKDADSWELLLGKERFKLAMIVAEMINDKLDVSATHIWTVLEAIKKAGLSANSPLVVDPDSSAQWLVFHSGEFMIFSSLINATSENTAICITAAFARSRGQTR